MTDPLEDAAAELDKVRADNEKRTGHAAEMAAMKRPAEAAQILAEVNARRMDLAAAWTRIEEARAARECRCRAARPEPQQDQETP